MQAHVGLRNPVTRTGAAVRVTGLGAFGSGLCQEWGTLVGAIEVLVRLDVGIASAAFRAGLPPLLQGMLTLMWFEDQPPVAYVEALHMRKAIDSPTRVDQLQSACHPALGDALPMKGSLALLRAAAKDYGHNE